VGLVGIITIGVSSYLVTYGPVLYEALRRRGWLAFLRAPGDRVGQDEQPPRGHIIVVGMNSLGRRIIHTLLERGEHVVVIDNDPAKLRSLRTDTVLGSAGDEAVLAEANLRAARVVISALQIEDINALLAYRCRQLGVPVSVHAFDPALIPELEEIGVDYLIVSKHDGTRQVAAALRQAGVGP
jgi:Trk K+ transport system NAD-binding subunit